jgi:hypothetical protein
MRGAWLTIAVVFGIRKRLGLPLAFFYAVCFALGTLQVSAQEAGGTKNVSDADVQQLFQEAKEAALKVSSELKEFVQDTKLGDKSTTGLVDQTARLDPIKKYKKDEIQSFISTDEIREGLKAVNEAAAKDKAGLREGLLDQIVGNLLHEAGHWKAYVDGKTAPSEAPPVHKRNDPRVLAPEEERNTRALISRLITSMKKLKCNVPGQPAPATPVDLGDAGALKGENASAWMKRLRNIVNQQILYRFKTVSKVEPWKSKREKVLDALKTLEDKLGEISKSSQGAEEKTKAAQNAYDDFTNAAGAEKAELEKQFDIKLDPKWDPKTFEAKPLDPEPSGQFGGEPIPDCPEPKENPKDSGAGGSRKGTARSAQRKASPTARAQKKCPPQSGGIVGAINGVTAQMGGCKK